MLVLKYLCQSLKFCFRFSLLLRQFPGKDCTHVKVGSNILCKVLYWTWIQLFLNWIGSKVDGGGRKGRDVLYWIWNQQFLNCFRCKVDGGGWEGRRMLYWIWIGSKMKDCCASRSCSRCKGSKQLQTDQKSESRHLQNSKGTQIRSRYKYKSNDKYKYN